MKNQKMKQKTMLRNSHQIDSKKQTNTETHTQRQRDENRLQNFNVIYFQQNFFATSIQIDSSHQFSQETRHTHTLTHAHKKNQFQWSDEVNEEKTHTPDTRRKNK